MQLANTPEDQSPELREQFRAVVQHVPDLFDALKDMNNSDDLYRAVISKKNLHLLREGADGIIRPALKGSKGRFVENVGLVKVKPDAWGGIASVAMQATLAEFSEKLNQIIEGIENLEQLVREANGGKLQGMINALESQRCLKVSSERRVQMLLACHGLEAEIGRMSGQLRSAISTMPEPADGFLQRLKSDGGKSAQKAWSQVHNDCAVIAKAIKPLIEAYQELDEHTSAHNAFTQISNSLVKELRIAENRARLLPFPSKGLAPETQLKRAIEGLEMTQENLELLAAGIIPTQLIITHAGQA
jgi:hypothetical protein